MCAGFIERHALHHIVERQVLTHRALWHSGRMASAQGAYRSRQFAYEQPIVPLTMAGCAVAMVVVAAVTEQNPGEWVAIAVGSAFLLAVCLIPFTVTVTREHLVVRFAGLFTATIPMQDVASAQAREYQPLKQFGGWGWRFGRNGARQYAMAGKRAVVVTRVDGREVYLGARDVESLAAAINAAHSASVSPR